MWNPLRLFVRNEAEEYSLSDDNVLKAFYGALSQLSSSGVAVNEQTAMRSTAVLACLIVRAQTVSTLPVDVLRQNADGSKTHDIETPEYRLLSIAPNDLMTSKEFWRWKQLREDTTGNAYARIVWDGYEPREIWPLTGPQPALVIDRATRTAAWNYTGDNFTPAGPIPLRDVLHFKSAVLTSPYEGRSLISLASEAIGVSIGTEQFFARLLGNGSHFPGYLETDRDLTPEDYKAISEQLKGFSGLLNAGQVRIFDRGLTYKQNDMSLKDAQLVEQMRWQLQQICSVFRVPMAAVQDLTNGTYSNTEQQDLSLAKYTAQPICVDTEAVIRHRLFAMKPAYSARFNIDSMLRGDYKTRTEGDAMLVRAGIIAPNEGRAHYDLNPVKGLERPRAELTLGTVTEDGLIHGPAAPLDAPPPAAQPATASAMLAPILSDAADRIRARFEADAKRGRSRADTEKFASEKLAPIAAACAAAGIPFDAAAFLADALEKNPLAGSGDTPGNMESPASGTEEE